MILELPVIGLSMARRDQRSNKLPVLHDLSSPLPRLPNGLVTAFLSRTQRQLLAARLRKSGGRCAFCGCRCPHGTLDHLIPRARGGCHSATNLVLSCRRCNAQKADRTAEEYLRELLQAARLLRRRLRSRQFAAA